MATEGAATTRHNAPARSLFVVFNRIGDLTISTPLFRALADRAELSLLTRPFGAPLLASQSYVRRVYSLRYPNRGRTAVGDFFLGGHRRALGRKLQGARFDEVLIYDVERPVIKRWLNDQFPGRVREIPRRQPPGGHASEIYRAGAAYLGCDMERYDPDPVLEITSEGRARAAELLSDLGRRVVGIQMGSQRTAAGRLLGARPDLKGLSTRQWRALVTRIVGEDHADAIVFHGAPSEAKMLRGFLCGLPDAVRRRCHNLSTRVGLDLLPAVLAGHQALISVDTGPVHIAAAVGCPVLVFFGPTDPAVFRPRGKGPIHLLTGRASCQFCHRTPLYKTCRDNRCLNRLEDDRLWEAWTQLRES